MTKQTHSNIRGRRQCLLAVASQVLFAALCASAVLALAGCAGVDMSGPFRDFSAGRYGAARAEYEARLAADGGGPEAALYRNSAGTAALVAGDVDAAHRLFRESFGELEDRTSTTGETVGAMVGPERSKRWKGDPYERCMNAYYLGVTSWLRGDVDNAAAAFRSGVLRDADSEEGETQSDFALLWYLLGQAQRAGAHEDRGERALAEAHRLLPKNPWLEPERAREANVLLVVDLGIGPEKVPTGPHGAWITFRRRPYAAHHAEIRIGTTALGRTERAVDLHHQATTRGDKVLDHVNQGKAVFKSAAIVGGAVVLAQSDSRTEDAIGAGLILAGLLLPAEADVRQWDTLPGEVHVLAAKLPPGDHTLTIDVRDRAGNPLPDLSRDVPVTVKEGRLAFVWTRAAPTERTHDRGR